MSGEKNGVEVSWHDNGQKAKETTYVEGRMVGKSTSWYPNGQKSQEGNYGEYTLDHPLGGSKKWGMMASGLFGMKTELSRGKII